MLVLSSGACIDLAANQVLPRNAQHEHLHVGDAGAAQQLAGNRILPTLVFANCAEYLASLSG